MCRAQSVLALAALCVGLAHSWDIAVSAGDSLQFYTNGTQTDIAHFYSGNLAALAYDEVHNMMLYVNKQTDHDTICGYSINFGYNRCFIKRYGGNIHSIAFDPVTETIFFTDTNEKSINWISLKSGSKKNPDGNLLIKMDDLIPSNIAVDSCRGYIYWSDINKGWKEHLERARFDGSKREFLHFRSFNILSLGIDPQTQGIYFIDGLISRKRNFGYLTRVDFDGRKSKIIFGYRKHISAPEVFTVSKDSVYWMNSSESFKTVWELPKNAILGEKPKEMFKIYTKGPFGIAANYKIKDQTKGNLNCEALSNLIPTITTGEEIFNVKITEKTSKIYLTTDTEMTTPGGWTGSLDYETDLISTPKTTPEEWTGSTDYTTDLIPTEQTISEEGSGSLDYETDLISTTQTIAEEWTGSTDYTTDLIPTEQTISEEGSGSLDYETDLISTPKTTPEEWTGSTDYTTDLIPTEQTISEEGSGSLDYETDLISTTQTIAEEWTGSTDYTTDLIPTEQTISEEGSGSLDYKTDLISTTQTIAEEWTGSTDYTTDLIKTEQTISQEGSGSLDYETDLISTPKTTPEEWTGSTDYTTDLIPTEQTTPGEWTGSLDYETGLISTPKTIAEEWTGSTDYTTDLIPTEQTTPGGWTGSLDYETDLISTPKTIAEEWTGSTDYTTDLIPTEQTTPGGWTGSLDYETDLISTPKTIAEEWTGSTEQTVDEEGSGYKQQTSDVVHESEAKQTPAHSIPGYIGERCDVSVCVNYCLQGNCSISEEGLPKCSCNKGYSGQHCEVNLCYNYCLNNGNCSLSYKDNAPVCQCGDNHEGSRCETDKNVNLHFVTNSTDYTAEKNLTLTDLLSRWRSRYSKIFVNVHNNYY